MSARNGLMFEGVSTKCNVPHTIARSLNRRCGCSPRTSMDPDISANTMAETVEAAVARIKRNLK